MTQQDQHAAIDLLSFSAGSDVPVILQAEVAECGLACIAMVASHHGNKLDLQGIRGKFSTSLKGVNLKQLMQIADELGLANRALQCDLEDIKKISLPAILHWDLNHFVVLVKVSGDKLTINDPAIGRRKLRLSEFSQHFTGVLLELTPTAEFRKRDERQTMSLRQLWSRLTNFYRTLGLLFALSIFLQFSALAAPYYMQWVVDRVLLTEDRSLLIVLAIGFSLLVILSTVTGAVRSYLVLRLSSVMSMQMGVNLLRHLLRLPMDYFEKRHIGDVVSRFGSLGSVRERITTGLVETIVDGVMSVLVLAVMLLYSVPLTLIVLASVAIYTVLRLIFYGPLYRASEEVIRASAKEQTNFLESIRGIQTIKLFTNESQRLNIWQNRFAEVVNADIRVGKLNIGFSIMSGLLFGLENILVIYLAALTVMNGELTIGMVLAFLAYKGQLSGRLSGLVEQLIMFKMLKLHLQRLSDIALEPQEAHRDAMVLASEGAGAIEVCGVSYRYGDNEPYVLKDISFSVMPGEAVAIVGASGGGKSTLMKLMLGLLTPVDGKIRMDQTDMYQLGLRAYRQQVAAVMQDDTLLAGSIADNICFFETEPNLLRIQQCAAVAAIHDEIAAMPMAYQTLVGDMGNQFSGGQIQRLLLARALYQQPRILFLDEATSHLDTQNETRIVEQISQLSMTRIIIAHRPETIRQADRVLRIDKGHLIEVSDVERNVLEG